MSRPFGGQVCRQLVGDGRLADQPGRLVVAGHRLGRGRRPRGHVGVEHPGHPLVDGAAVAAQERFVGGLLDQGVLEVELAVRAGGVGQDQARLHHPGQVTRQEGRVHAGHGHQQVEGEAGTDDGGQLGHRLGLAQAVQPGQERPLQRSGDVEVGEGRGEVPGLLAPHQDPRLEHRPPDLLDVEGDAARRSHDPLDHRVGQGAGAPERRHHGPHVGVLQGLEGEGGHPPAVRPGGLELGSGGHEEEDPGVGEAPDQPVEGVDGGGVRPVQVLDGQDQRLAAAQRHQPGHPDVDGPLESQLGGRARLRAGGDPEQGGEQLVGLGDVDTVGGQTRPQPGQPPGGIGVGAEAEDLLDQVDQRAQDAHRGVRGARALDPEMLVPGHQLAYLEHQPGLADPGLTPHQDRPAVPRPDLAPHPDQGVELVLSTHQGGPVLGWHGAPRVGVGPGPDQVGLDRAGHAAQGERAELGDVEASPDLGDGGRAGHHGAGLGEALESGGHVQGLAHRHVGPATLPAELTDHGGATVDPDPHRQGLAPVEGGDRVDDVQGRRQGLGGVVAVRLGPAEPEEDAVAAVALDVAPGGPDDGDRPFLVGLDQLAVVLDVGGRRERRRADQVAEDDGQVAQLGAQGLPDRLLEGRRCTGPGDRLTTGRAEPGAMG